MHTKFLIILKIVCFIQINITLIDRVENAYRSSFSKDVLLLYVNLL